jgi:hypothetical protein
VEPWAWCNAERRARVRGPAAHPVGFWVAVIRTADSAARRIRLVAYGARLESVLGASPRGFESPILRQFLHSLSAPRSE